MIAASHKPNPKLKIKTSRIITGKNKRFQENSAPVKIITSNKAPSEKSKFTNELPTLETVKIYFGTYVFLINGAFPVIEATDIFVASVIKLKRNCPEII